MGRKWGQQPELQCGRIPLVARLNQHRTATCPERIDVVFRVTSAASSCAGSKSGFSLVETLFAIGLVGALSVGLVQLFVLSEQLNNASREQLHALQVLESKLESVRAFGWNRLCLAQSAPIWFYETNGFVMAGSLTVRTNAFYESYGNHVLQATARVTWTSGHKEKSEQLSTCISFYEFAPSR